MTNSFEGNIREDHFGRIVVDRCISDEYHLRSSETDPVENRPKCRKLIEECFRHLLGRKGTLLIKVEFYPEGSLEE